MRAVIAIAVVVLILVLIGWVSFGVDGGTGTVEFDSDKAQQDTEAIAEGVRDLASEAADGLRETARDDNVDGAVEDPTNATEPTPVVDPEDAELEPI